MTGTTSIQPQHALREISSRRDHTPVPLARRVISNGPDEAARPWRCSFINSVCVEHDAISNSIRAEIEALSSLTGGAAFETKLFTYACDFPEIDHVTVKRWSDVLFDSFFLSSGLVIYHFGIYYDLFDSLLLGLGRQRRVVHYHNVTPISLVPPEDRPLIEKSLTQVQNLTLADHVWADSETNRTNLLSEGIDSDRVSVLELRSFCRPPVAPKPSRRPGQPVTLLYVGRFVPAKGVMHLLETARSLLQEGVSNFVLRLVGTLRFADQHHLDDLRSFIAASDMSDRVEILGDLSDAELAREYTRADAFVTASAHEGFCVPIVEAFQHGCYVIAYGSGNLPSIISGYGSVVPTGDRHALAGAIHDFVNRLTRASEEARTPSVRTSRGEVPLPDFQGLVQRHALRYSSEAFRDRFLKAVGQELAELEPRGPYAASGLGGRRASVRDRTSPLAP